MTTEYSRDFLGMRLCEIFGIDYKNVKSVTLQSTVAEPDKVTFEMYLPVDKLQEIDAAVKQVEFVSANGLRLMVVDRKTQYVERDKELSTEEKEYLWLRDKTELGK